MRPVSGNGSWGLKGAAGLSDLSWLRAHREVMVAGTPMGPSIVRYPLWCPRATCSRAISLSRQPSLLGPSRQAMGNMLGRAVVACGPSCPAIPFPSRWSYYTSNFGLLHVWMHSCSGQMMRSLPFCLHPHCPGASSEFNDLSLTKPSVSWRAYACVACVEREE